MCSVQCNATITEPASVQCNAVWTREHKPPKASCIQTTPYEPHHTSHTIQATHTPHYTSHTTQASRPRLFLPGPPAPRSHSRGRRGRRYRPVRRAGGRTGARGRAWIGSVGGRSGAERRVSGFVRSVRITHGTKHKRTLHTAHARSLTRRYHHQAVSLAVSVCAAC